MGMAAVPGADPPPRPLQPRPLGNFCQPVYPRARGAASWGTFRRVLPARLPPPARGSRTLVPPTRFPCRSSPARAGAHPLPTVVLNLSGFFPSAATVPQNHHRVIVHVGLRRHFATGSVTRESASSIMIARFDV